MWKYLKRMHLIQTGSLPKVHHITAASLSAITTPTPFPVLHQAGVGGSAAARLQEAKQRARLLKELDEASKRVSRSITELQRKYGDVLLYKVGGAGQQGFLPMAHYCCCTYELLLFCAFCATNDINTIAFLPTEWAISREDVPGPHRNAVLFATRASP